MAWLKHDASGGTAFAHAVNLGDEPSIVALVMAVMERYGRIDILHNNAANTGAAQMIRDGALTAMEAEVWDAAFDINTRGTMLMTKHVAPHMMAGGGGSIINTSSGVSILGDVLNPAYSASKAAVNALTRNTATQFGRGNIRCNAILPGLVLSPVARAQMTEAQLRMIQRHVLLPRESVADDIAGAVLWLASAVARVRCGSRPCSVLATATLPKLKKSCARTRLPRSPKPSKMEQPARLHVSLHAL